MAEMMNLKRYVEQRKRHNAMAKNPGRDQGRIGIPKNASPDKWDAPEDELRGGHGKGGPVRRVGPNNGAYGPTEPYSYGRVYDNKTGK